MKIKLSKSQWDHIGKTAGWIKGAISLYPDAEKKVIFCGTECNIEKKQYQNGRAALRLVSAKDDPETDSYAGELVATATVNIPNIDLEYDEVIIKNYSENEGLFEILLDANIIEDTGKRVSVGFVKMPIAKMLI